jgi:hypothetical protein
MKRSEMVGKIEVFLRLWQDRRDPRGMAEEIMRMCERNGMNPPKVITEKLLNGGCIRVETNDWERENA